MKRLHVAFIIVGIVILLATTGWGLLYLYASQDSVPDGTTAGDVQIGGLGTKQALDKLDEAGMILSKCRCGFP